MNDGAARELLMRVYGDSLSLPRANDGIPHRHSWAELVTDGLRARNPKLAVSLYNRSGGGLTISALHERYLHDCSYFGTPQHQLLVIQCGIVDCAPRPIPATVRSLIGKLPGRARAPIISALHHLRPSLLKAGLSWRLTPPGRFSKVLSQWLAHAASQHSRVFVVNIAPTVPTIASHSPGLEQNIAAYNSLIATAVKQAPARTAVLINIHDVITRKGNVATWVSAADGHHITSEGNQLYAELVLQQFAATEPEGPHA